MLYVPPTKQTGFPGGSVIMNPPSNTRETGLIPGLGRSPGEGNHLENNNPLQYSCLGNTKGREAWWATVHRVTKRVGQDWATKITTKQTTQT